MAYFLKWNGSECCPDCPAEPCGQCAQCDAGYTDYSARLAAFNAFSPNCLGHGSPPATGSGCCGASRLAAYASFALNCPSVGTVTGGDCFSPSASNAYANAAISTGTFTPNCGGGAWPVTPGLELVLTPGDYLSAVSEGSAITKNLTFNVWSGSAWCWPNYNGCGDSCNRVLTNFWLRYNAACDDVRIRARVYFNMERYVNGVINASVRNLQFDVTGQCSSCDLGAGNAWAPSNSGFGVSDTGGNPNIGTHHKLTSVELKLWFEWNQRNFDNTNYKIKTMLCVLHALPAGGYDTICQGFT